MREDIFYMRNKVKNYDWGGTKFIPNLLGEREDLKPWAELWMGAHPSFSSEVLVNGVYKSLFNLLKEKSLVKNRDELNFLFKVLSIEKPLSIQVHPSKEQAIEGFKRENITNISLNSFERTYKDLNNKRELLYALDDFYVLKGFLAIDEIKKIYDLLNISFDFNSHKEWISALFNLSESEIKTQIDLSLENREKLNSLKSYWSLEFFNYYSYDIGFLIALGMNIIHLKKGEALFIEEGEVHAYLRGNCIELMTNSDNVIRAGFTNKYVERDEFFKIALLSNTEAKLINYEMEGAAKVFLLKNTDLALFYLREDENLKRDSLMIAFCLSGQFKLNSNLTLKKGESAFVLENREKNNLSIKGEGELFIAKNV